MRAHRLPRPLSLLVLGTQVLLAWAGAWTSLCMGHAEGPHLGSRWFPCEHEGHEHPAHSGGSASDGEGPARESSTVDRGPDHPHGTPGDCRQLELPIAGAPALERPEFAPRLPSVDAFLIGLGGSLAPRPDIGDRLERPQTPRPPELRSAVDSVVLLR